MTGCPVRLPPPASSRHGVGWKVNRQLATQLGLQRAFLMHLAHPLVATAIADHSIFAGCPHEGWGRLQRTVERMAALWSGDRDQSAHAAAALNAIHGRVHGMLPAHVGIFPAGTPYAATDPELLLWVHATLLDSLLRSYQLFVGPLSATERDQYCLDAVPVGAHLGIPPELIPTSADQLDDYLAATMGSGAIQVGETAKTLAGNLLAPPIPRAGRPLARMVRLTSAGLLPATIRQEYGLTWTRRHETTLRAAAAFVRLGRPLIPSVSIVLAGFRLLRLHAPAGDRVAPTA